MRAFQSLTLLGLALLSACSSQSSSLPPSNPTLPKTDATHASVSIRIVVPSATKASKTRRPAYVSPSTTYVTVTDVAGAQQHTVTFTCSNGTCTDIIAAPVGSNTFTFALYDVFQRPVSSGSDTATIIPGQINTVSVTFNAVVTSIAMPYLNAAYGTSQQISFTAKALDADDNVIVGPGSYEDANGNPLTITAKVTDALGAATLTKSTSTGPNDPMTLAYSGTRHDKAIIDSTNTASLPTTNGSFVAIGAVSSYTYAGNGPPVMTIGPDQALWLATDSPGGFNVIRVANDGTQTTYAVPGPPAPFSGTESVEPSGITTGPDGNLWVTGSLSGVVARITPSGTATVFSGGLIELSNISVGPDGNLWFGNGIGADIARITTAGTISTYSAGQVPGAPPNAPTVTAFGSNGLLYFLNAYGNSIDQFNISTHAVSETVVPNGILPTDMIEGADGNIQFAGYVSGVASYVGSMTPSGTIATKVLPYGVNIAQVINGGDGSPWYLDSSFGLRWVDASGEIGGYPLTFTTNGGAEGVCVGADGSFWVATYNAQGNTFLQHMSY